MRFQITTDYAIRIMSYMYTRSDECLTAKQMAGELGMTYQYFMKVMNYLKQAKWVTTVQGCNGGFTLAEEAKYLTLYDIVRVIEGDLIINRCLEEDKYCSRCEPSSCPIHNVFVNLQNEMIESLSKVTIAELAI